MVPKVQARLLAANKAKRTDKKGLAAGTIYLFSPETISFLRVERSKLLLQQRKERYRI